MNGKLLNLLTVTFLLVSVHASGATRVEMLDWMRNGDTSHCSTIIKGYPSVWKGDLQSWNHDKDFLELAPHYVEALAAAGMLEEAKRFQDFTIEQFVTHDKYDADRKISYLRSANPTPSWRDPEYEGTGMYRRILQGRYIHKSFRATMAAMDAAIEAGERKAKEEALRQAKEAERIAREKAEAERKAREEAQRIAREKAEAERIAREEAQRIAREKAEAERKAREKAQRIAREKAEAERKAREEMQRIAKMRSLVAEGKGRWLETTDGVKLFFPSLATPTSATWTGPSFAGIATGEGELTILFKQPVIGDGVPPYKGQVVCDWGMPDFLKPPVASDTDWVFVGKVDKKGRPRGFGVLKNRETAIVGTFRGNGSCRGAVTQYMDGTNVIYQGDFAEYRYAGEGVLLLMPEAPQTFVMEKHGVAKAGDTLRGRFANGNPHGAGIIVHADGKEEVRVFRNGLIDSESESIVSRLDRHKPAVETECRGRIAQRVFWHQSNRKWVNAILCLLFLAPIAFLAKKYDQRESVANRYLDEPLQITGLIPSYVFGGLLGMHKVKALTPLWSLYAFLTPLWLMLNVSNIYRAITNPSFAITLWHSSVMAWVVFGILAAILVYDLAIGMRYDVYSFNARYWRATNTKPIEEAKAVAAEAPSVVEECIKTAKENFKYLDARGSEDVGWEISDWWTTGKIDREREKLGELAYSYHEIVEKSKEYVAEVEKLESLLRSARLTATRNFKLAKEIMAHYSTKTRGRTERTVVDNLALREIEENPIDMPEDQDLEVQPLDFDGLSLELDKVFTGRDIAIDGMQRMSESGDDADEYAMGLASAISGVATAVSGAIQIATSVVEYYQRKKEVERTIVSQQAKIIEAAQNACGSLLHNKAKVKRAAEILKALAKCNSAFVDAYAGLRDDVFGEPSFVRFRIGEGALADEFMEKNRGNRIFARRIAYLLKVCSEYRKVSLAEIEPGRQGEVLPAETKEPEAGTSKPAEVGFSRQNDEKTDATPEEAPVTAVAKGPVRTPNGANDVANAQGDGESAGPLPPHEPATPEPTHAKSASDMRPPDERPPMRYADFVVAGLFTGWFGMHLAYAARWREFAVTMVLAFLAGGAAALDIPEVQPFAIAAMAVWWIATFFIVKTDGRGRKFRSIFDTMEEATGGDSLALLRMNPEERKAFSRKVKTLYNAPTCTDRSPNNRIVYILLSLLVGATGLNNLYIHSRREGRVSIALLAALVVSIVLNALARGDECAVLLILTCVAMFFWNIYCAFFVTEDGCGRKLRWF